MAVATIRELVQYGSRCVLSHCVTSDEVDRMEHLEFRRQIILGLVGTTD